MKAGANNVEQVQIKKLAAQGNTAAQISTMLLIEESTVEKFMPPKPAKKATPKKE